MLYINTKRNPNNLSELNKKELTFFSDYQELTGKKASEDEAGICNHTILLTDKVGKIRKNCFGRLPWTVRSPGWH